MSGSGLKFNLGAKAKSKPGQTKPPAARPALFAADSDDEDEQGQQAGGQISKRQRTDAPEGASPSGRPDPEQQTTADKLAEFVAKHGRSFEEVTRQRNPQGGPFKFLFDTSSPGYRYYEERLAFYMGKQPQQPGFLAGAQPPPPPAPQAAAQPRLNATQPAPGPALGKRVDKPAVSAKPAVAAAGGDSLAAMEAFTQLAAKRGEERAEAEAKVPLLNETAYDRRRTTAVYKQDGSRGHHMQDYIPPEELAAFLAKSGSKEAAAQAEAIEAQQRIQADNIGHRLLSQMGWKEGQGLGSGGAGRAAPIAAGQAAAAGEKRGLGAVDTATPQAGEDQFETYRKRMMLGYKHRPNPLGNPRKSYY